MSETNEAVTQNKTMSGTVKWYHPQKGYGFIIGEDGAEYYVYHESIQTPGFRKLRKGEGVTFEVGSEVKGNINAIHVVPDNAVLADK